MTFRPSCVGAFALRRGVFCGVRLENITCFRDKFLLVPACPGWALRPNTPLLHLYSLYHDRTGIKDRPVCAGMKISTAPISLWNRTAQANPKTTGHDCL